MDNLAMAYLDRVSYQKFSNDDLERARQLMLVVVEQRKKKLGKEHPYTLWAICNLARVESVQGSHSEAEHLVRAGIMYCQVQLRSDSHCHSLWKIYTSATSSYMQTSSWKGRGPFLAL